MTYVDGFIVPVPEAKREEYRAMCKEYGERYYSTKKCIWIE